MKTGSPRKSKTLWLLFAAPLLVPLAWLGRDYYENHKQFVKVRLSGIPQRSSKFASLQQIKPFEELSQLLIRYPNANRLVVEWMDRGSYTKSPNNFLSYSRRDKELRQYADFYHDVTAKGWNNVNDKAIHMAAGGETKGQDENPPFLYKSSYHELRKSGARLVESY